MLQEFSILHRRKPFVFEHTDARTWITCLRSLKFGASHSMDLHDEFYSGADAYRFVLEVVCGLHSPIVGETEVLGQFKIFAQAWLKEDSRWTSLVQRVLADAKAIRSTYLNRLGHQSYGSWLRKNLKPKHIHILGAGNLTQEVLPYLLKQATRVTLHVRDPKRVTFHCDVQNIRDRGFDHGALIVAAPMNAQDIRTWLNGKTPNQIFDLRDNSNTDPLQLKTEQHGLHDIFTQIEQTKTKLKPLIEQVKHKIYLCSQEANHQVLIRPQGWDDLCA
jgi:glutamyl-tRNA reductase